MILNLNGETYPIEGSVYFTGRSEAGIVIQGKDRNLRKLEGRNITFRLSHPIGGFEGIFGRQVVGSKQFTQINPLGAINCPRVIIKIR